MVEKWKKIKSKQIFVNKIFGFREDLVVSHKTNKEHPVWAMDVPDWINIIPITPDGKVIFIKQYRFGTEEITLEVPGGMVEKDEDPKLAAVREMTEETGYTSDEVHQIGVVTPNPALMTNKTFSYVALNVEKTEEQNLDSMEDIEVLEVGLDEVKELIKNGEINHALVVSAFYFLNEFKQNNGS